MEERMEGGLVIEEGEEAEKLGSRVRAQLPVYMEDL